MADLKTTTKIIDNPRECVFAFQYQYVDTGNESAVNKIDVSTSIGTKSFQKLREREYYTKPSAARRKRKKLRLQKVRSINLD